MMTADDLVARYAQVVVDRALEQEQHERELEALCDQIHRLRLEIKGLRDELVAQ